MRLDDSDERGPRGLSGFEADPAVELRGALRDVAQVGDVNNLGAVQRDAAVPVG